MTFREDCESVRQALREWIEENPKADEPHDFISETADSEAPVYNGTLLDYAAESNDIALRAPDIGPAFDGTPTPINIIAANIYELLEEEMWDEWRKWESEKDDLSTCPTCDELVYPWEEDESVECRNCDNKYHIKCLPADADVDNYICPDHQEETEENVEEN